MAFTTQTDIRNYFDSILSDLELPNYTLDGNQFRPDGKTPFVRVKGFPQEMVNAALGSQRKSLKGLVQADVCVPRASGIDAAMAIAETIQAAFPTQTNALSAVNPSNKGSIIIYSAWVDKTNEEDAYLRIPVFIRYEAIAIPT
jgi:hypothetical protein